MADDRASIGGLVLAAGAGRRFGGSKLLAELGGRPLLDHAIEAMLGVPAIERIVVVLGANASEITTGAELARVETVVCDDWREGMAASLRTGVEALAGCEAIVVTLGDQPFITPQVIATVTGQLGAPEAAARATYDGRPGHPVLIKRRLFEAVRSLRGDAGARDLLAAAGVRDVESAQLCRPDDVDTPDDLEAARRALAETYPADGYLQVSLAQQRRAANRVPDAVELRLDPAPLRHRRRFAGDHSLVELGVLPGSGTGFSKGSSSSS